jgi:hypothetical protein
MSAVDDKIAASVAAAPPLPPDVAQRMRELITSHIRQSRETRAELLRSAA